MKVSVVIPVYNAGIDIERSIGSMLTQTLPPDQLEIIAVDDGSTDGSGARLDAIAAEHPQLRVIHTPNSGWAGRPRNIGIAAARGEYVQLLDQDDWMPEWALERLYRMGVENAADIVIGKVASDFRRVPVGVFRTTVPRCTIWDFPLVNSLTPHKMFRTAFLREHELQFPEGRRRLEDQVFVMRAYFAASNVSILADRAYYYYARRSDNTNAGRQTIEPEGYYANLREVLEVVYDNTAPGPVRNQLLRRSWRYEMLARLNEPGYLRWDPDYRAALFSAVRGLGEAMIPPEVDDDLAPVLRTKATLVRHNRPEALLELDRRLVTIELDAAADAVSWSAGRLTGRVRLRLVRGGVPLTLARRAGTLLLDPALTDDLTDPIVIAEPVTWRGDVWARHRDTGEEWAVQLREPQLELVPMADDPNTLVPELVASAVLDPLLIAGHHRLPPGAWRLVARLIGPGIERRGPVPAPAELRERLPAPALLGDPPHPCIPIVDDQGVLGIDIDRTATTLGAALAGRPVTPLAQEGSLIRIGLPIVMRMPTTRLAVDVELGAGDDPPRLPAWLEPHEAGRQHAVLAVRAPARRLPAGRYPAVTRLDGPSGLPVPIGVFVVDERGRLTLEGARQTGRWRSIPRAARRTATGLALRVREGIPRARGWLRRAGRRRRTARGRETVR